MIPIERKARGWIYARPATPPEPRLNGEAAERGPHGGGRNARETPVESGGRAGSVRGDSRICSWASGLLELELLHLGAKPRDDLRVAAAKIFPKTHPEDSSTSGGLAAYTPSLRDRAAEQVNCFRTGHR